MLFFSYERFFQTKLLVVQVVTVGFYFVWKEQTQCELLNAVDIPGFNKSDRNRDRLKGGGVGYYVKTDIKMKERMKDLMNLDESIEHQWIQIAGQKKSFNIIISNFYQTSSKLQDKLAFLKKFEKLLAQVTILHNDRLKKSVETERYTDILDAFHLIQHGTQPTRKSKSLINHIISTQDSTSNCLIMT